MSTPGFVLGGHFLNPDGPQATGTAELTAFAAAGRTNYTGSIGDSASPYPKDSLGQFGKYPGATPKYALNRGPRDNEYRETMARLFIQMTEQERTLFVDSVPQETQALAKVLCGVGSAGSGGTGFVDFILTQAVEALQEKIQIVETLSDNFVLYTFGQQAPQFQYSGYLYNTYQDDQRVWLMRLYRDILRSTQLARRRKLVRLRYDSVIVSGVLVNLQESITGDAVDHAQFSFTLVPMEYTIYTPAIGNPTRLRTGFTEGSAYGLTSMQPQRTTQQSVAQVGVSPDGLKRTNEKTDVPYRQITITADPVTIFEDRLKTLQILPPITYVR